MTWTSSFMSTFPTLESGLAVCASVVLMSTSWLRCVDWLWSTRVQAMCGFGHDRLAHAARRGLTLAA